MRLIIDTDPGIDDGVALVMALRQPEVIVEAITVVQGNAGLAHTVRNARLVTEACGVDVPVFAGAHHPIARPAPRRPPWINGKDGFGDIGLRPHRRRADPGFAADRIVEAAMRSPGEITLVTLGPLTNIALALAREPRLPKAIRGLVMMGGTVRAEGNLTPVAEFNVYADPEAAKTVFAAGFDLTMAGIELSRGAARLTEEDVAAIAALDTPAARLAGALLGHSLRIAARRPSLPGEHGVACSDAVAMAIALDPSIMTEHTTAHVDVETSGALTTGMTVVDRLGLSGHPANTRVAYAIDAGRFKALLRRCCTAR
jgi:purine nucleosidase